MRFRTKPLLISLVLGLVGCGETTGSGGAAVVRDSLGIQVAESHAPAWRPADRWSLVPEPELVIGEMEGDERYQFSGIRDVRRLSAGGFAVANGGSGEVRIFSADGRHLHSVGGAGGGPGEFRSLDWVRVLPGDSLAVFDGRERRLSVFSPEGALARVVSVHADPSAGALRVLDVMADGNLLSALVRFPDGPPANGLNRAPSSVSRISPEGASLNAITDLLGDERTIRAEYAAGALTSISVLTHPFHRGAIVRTTGGRVYAADTDRYEVRVFAADGRLEQIIRRPGDPLPVGEDEIEAYRRSMLEGAESAEQRRSVESRISDLVLPETRPAFATFRVDTGGRLWVQAFQVVEDEASLWSVFDTDGRWLGEVEIPERFRPTEIGDGYVLGVWKDALDVEYVRLYTFAGR